jgi:hypothetical protein
MALRRCATGRHSCVPRSEQYRHFAQACLLLARNAEDERVNETDERQLAES